MEGQRSKAANHRFKSGAAFIADEVKITNHIYLCVCMCVRACLCLGERIVSIMVDALTSYMKYMTSMGGCAFTN